MLGRGNHGYGGSMYEGVVGLSVRDVAYLQVNGRNSQHFFKGKFGFQVTI